MSEYMEKHSVSRLVGSPPGYIGYDEGGQLTEAVRRKPYSVVLMDEIEKAHPDVFNILLQILEEGKLTDAQGRRVDFRNTIVIMTSNIGAASISKNQSFGFSVGDESGLSYDEMKSRVMGELKKVFRPELLNRIDEIIVFHKLDKEEIKTIVDLLLKRLREQMATHEVTVELTDEAKDLLVDKGYDAAMGARPLRRAIQRYIEDPLADHVLGRQLEPGSTILVSRKAGAKRVRRGRGGHHHHPRRDDPGEGHRPAGRACSGGRRLGRRTTKGPGMPGPFDRSFSLRYALTTGVCFPAFLALRRSANQTASQPSVADPAERRGSRKPMPESSRAIPTTMPKLPSCVRHVRRVQRGRQRRLGHPHVAGAVRDRLMRLRIECGVLACCSSLRQA